MAGHGSAGAARRAAAAWEISDSDSEEPPGGGGSLRVPTPPRDPAPCPSRSRQRRTRSLGVGVGAAGLGREQQRADRARKKAQDALEKRQRREAAQALRPEQCLKYVAVCVHPGGPRGAAPRHLDHLPAALGPSPGPAPGSVSWRLASWPPLGEARSWLPWARAEEQVLALVTVPNSFTVGKSDQPQTLRTWAPLSSSLSLRQWGKVGLFSSCMCLEGVN